MDDNFLIDGTENVNCLYSVLLILINDCYTWLRISRLKCIGKGKKYESAQLENYTFELETLFRNKKCDLDIL